MKPQFRHLWRFVLFAFLANVLMPFFAVYNVSELSAASAKNGLFGDRILVCTADGFRWITRSEASKQLPHHPASHYECALCYVASHGLKHLILPTGIALACVLLFIATQMIIEGLATRITFRPRFQFSRAPPAFSF